MTQAEISRWIESHDRTHGNLVSVREFELVMKNMAEDIAETKETVRWMQRLLVTQLVAFGAGIVLYLVNTVAP
jgi:hypothetical protein